jgi:hypothetical protein
VADPVSRNAARTATLVAVPIALLVGVLAFWQLGGFGGGAKPKASRSATPTATGPVSVPAPALTGGAILTCRAFIAALPDEVRKLPRRPVSDGVEQNAAYGDPAITVSCGVPAPTVAPTAQVFAVSGVCWYAQQGSTGTSWTTVDRTVPVVVTVPKSYSGPGQWAAEFNDTIISSLPSSTTKPTGCG